MGRAGGPLLTQCEGQLLDAPNALEPVSGPVAQFSLKEAVSKATPTHLFLSVGVLSHPYHYTPPHCLLSHWHCLRLHLSAKLASELLSSPRPRAACRVLPLKSPGSLAVRGGPKAFGLDSPRK